MTQTWMIYGATGYSGGLIAHEAKQRGHEPILAGRSPVKTRELAERLGCQSRIFDLSDPDEIARNLDGVALVLHCAGPFSTTSMPMMTACIQSNTHYLDITGEIDVFEAAQSLNAQATNAGVVLCPGVGFDVIPTDCVAAALKDALPDATHLCLGFHSRSSASPGTAKTSVEGLAGGGKVRRDGQIVTVPLGYKSRRIDFGDGEKMATTIPWGDVSTAYYTTGIPNIEVFMSMPEKTIAKIKYLRLIRPILALGAVQTMIKGRIEKKVKGPSDKSRQQAKTLVWGEVTNAQGTTRTARMVTANGYDVTITGSLAVVDHLLNHPVKGGAYTPARLVDPGLAERLPGSSPIHIS